MTTFTIWFTLECSHTNVYKRTAKNKRTRVDQSHARASGVEMVEQQTGVSSS